MQLKLNDIGVIMYLLTAIFSKNCLKEVLLDLKEHDIEGVTISNVSGKGAFMSDDEVQIHLDENIRMEIVVSSDKYKELVKEVIRSNTRELTKGSGKMWVTQVLEVERIRTGEVNEAALSHPNSANNTLHIQNYFTPIDTPAS